MNISSIIVKVLPQDISEVIPALKKADFCEYHLHDDNGNIIVTIEGNDVSEEIRKMKKLELLTGVISANMSFAYSEEELEKERESLENTKNNLPEWMNRDDVKAEDILYKGDLRKKDL